MSGEIVPELAALLREIAERIEAGTANPDDAEALRRLARHAAGEDGRYSVKVHSSPGQKPLGVRGVARRFAMAQAVKDYMELHRCSNEAAREALNGNFGNVGPETLRKAWQEMAPLLEMDAAQREIVLSFKRLEAKGLAKVTRKKG